MSAIRINRRGVLPSLVMLVLLSLSVGCVKTMQPGSLHQVQPFSDQPRAGNVYLVRGFIGVFSSGVDSISEQLNELGVRAHVYQDDQWAALARTIRERYRQAPDAEPLVLIGHSYGADDVIRIARELDKAGVPVDLLVTLDPVTPRRIPKNVRHALNIYQSNALMDKLPFLRGVAVRPDREFAGQLDNFDIKIDRQDLREARTSHFNIEEKGKIREEVVGYVLMTCPPRATWLTSRGRSAPAAGAARLASTPPERSTVTIEEPDRARTAGHQQEN